MVAAKIPPIPCKTKCQIYYKTCCVPYLASQHRGHVLRGEAAGKTKQTTLEDGSEDIDEDDGDESGRQELQLPGVSVYLDQHQGGDEQDHHQTQGPQQPRLRKNIYSCSLNYV